MSDTPPPSRPKIQVLRLPSYEQAKLRPLLEGGVQLRAQFQHMRYGDYASSLDDANKQCFSFHDHEYVGHKVPMATKSLDNIFARQLTSSTGEQGSKVATRSEEQLYYASYSLPGAICPAHKASRFSGARSRISAFLKKLSPRLRHKAAAPNSPCPWVVVEFSNQDLESPDASERANSVTSDYSVDMALQASRLWREQAENDDNIHRQVLCEGSDKPCKQGEAEKHQTPSRGLAATKHRAAFNTGNRQVSGGTAAAKVKAKVAAASRPHTLRIQLSSHQHNSSMASDESIGSCSLDADVTASDASECVDLGTVSAHTLRSVQLSTKTPDPDCTTTKSPGGTSTPEYVKRTARLFESSDTTALGSQSSKTSLLRSNGRHVGSSKTSDVSSVVVVNGTNSVKSGENLLNGDGFTGKKPSYLGLACSISGYSGITTYDSKLREGFLARDHSPGRLGILKSRDVSPLRQGADQFENRLIPTYKSDCGNFLVAPPMKAGVVGGGDKVESISFLKSRPNVIEGATSGFKNVRTPSSGSQIDVVSDVNGFDQLGRKNSKVQSSHLQGMMGDDGKFSVTVQHTVNGVSEKTGITADGWDHRRIENSHLDNCTGSSKQEFFSDSKSNIQESTRNFMSSMLTAESSFSSTYYESSVIQQTTTNSREVTDFCSVVKNSQTSVPKDGFGAFSPIKCSPESPKTAPKDFHGSHVTSYPRDSSSLLSSLKHSPDSPETSKDSLSAPATTSPQKRSPGAVRVVEFTSQTKSYVRTAFVSTNSVESTATFTTQGYLDSPQLKDVVDGSQTTGHVKSVSSGLTICGSVDSGRPSDTSATQIKCPEFEATAWASKSFIQQRVERLYGPGALAQGFFRRTRHKPADQVQGPSESCTPHNGHRNNSSPALPVLRHLRPEFRAQLSLGPTARKLHERDAGTSAVEETRPSIYKRSATEVIPLQQQISVESLAESLPDLQPAAPDVVLPIEQSHTISSQPSERSEEIVGPVIETHKDGHYFLKLLKQETERLNGLVEMAETDLAKGELLPEEALGKLRAASGQARLLIRQKLQQFEGLCHKNIAQNSEEPFPTTSEDLAGFWDMVMLQVEHVNRLFEEITALRAANWVEAKVVGTDVADSAPKRRVGGGTRRSAAASSKSSASSEATRKAREEGRRKLMEERRKAMREKRDAAATSGQVEIFVPQENGN